MRAVPTRVPLQSARAVGRDQTIRSWIGISRRAPGEGVPWYESSVETTHACGMAASAAWGRQHRSPPVRTDSDASRIVRKHM